MVASPIIVNSIGIKYSTQSNVFGNDNFNFINPSNYYQNKQIIYTFLIAIFMFFNSEIFSTDFMSLKMSCARV